MPVPMLMENHEGVKLRTMRRISAVALLLEGREVAPAASDGGVRDRPAPDVANADASASTPCSSSRKRSGCCEAFVGAADAMSILEFELNDAAIKSERTAKLAAVQVASVRFGKRMRLSSVNGMSAPNLPLPVASVDPRHLRQRWPKRRQEPEEETARREYKAPLRRGDSWGDLSGGRRVRRCASVPTRSGAIGHFSSGILRGPTTWSHGARRGGSYSRPTLSLSVSRVHLID